MIRSRPPDAVYVAPTKSVNAADITQKLDRPGIIQPVALRRERELALGRRVHGEFVRDGDLGPAVAVDVGGCARDDSRRLRGPVTTRFFQVGFSYQAHVLPPTAIDVGLPVAVDVGHLDLIGAREVCVDDDAVEFLSSRQ